MEFNEKDRVFTIDIKDVPFEKSQLIDLIIETGKRKSMPFVYIEDEKNQGDI